MDATIRSGKGIEYHRITTGVLAITPTETRFLTWKERIYFEIACAFYAVANTIIRALDANIDSMEGRKDG